MKAFLKFDIPEETEEFEDAINGGKYKCRLDDVWDKLFRPRHKHGFNNPEINTLLEDEKCDKLMDLIEEEYRSLIKEWE